MKSEFKEVNIEDIFINPYQPRKIFSEEELWELAESIKSVGIIHPPVVRPLDLGKYELVSGERRYRASQLAGFKTIEVLVKIKDNQTSAEAALIENVQRVDLNPLEIAKALKSLITQFDFNQEELAKKIGKKRSTIANYLRLLTLPSSIQKSVDSGAITMGHAKAILSLDDEEKQMLLHELILRDDLTVREAEEASQRIMLKAQKKELTYETRDFFIEHLSHKVQQKLGTKVFIQSKGKKGRIMIDYYSLDDLDRLLEIFGVDPN